MVTRSTKKRKAASSPKTSSSSSTKGKTDNKKMFGGKKKSKQVGGAMTMFQEIAEDAEDYSRSQINMEGIALLGEKLDMDVVEDIRILVLLWKLECKAKPGCISAAEWIKGCGSLSIDSWDSLKKLVPSLDTGFLEASEYRDFYKFCFSFNLAGTHRTLDKELVVALLPMVAKDRVPSDRLETFVEFLESSDQYTRITMDQWTSFLDFSLEVSDLADYDESTSAWPVMIDEYVEHMDKVAKK